MTPRLVWTRLLPDRVVLSLATLGPLGRLPAPGTWGSFAGLMWATVIGFPAGPLPAALFTVLTVYLAVAICGEAELRLRKTDPGEIILDEFVCMPVVLLGLHDILATTEAWVAFILAFLLFRFFDIFKPLGIARLQRYPGGLGVVLDDLAAAVAAAVVLQVVLRFSPFLSWLRGFGAAVAY